MGPIHYFSVVFFFPLYLLNFFAFLRILVAFRTLRDNKIAQHLFCSNIFHVRSRLYDLYMFPYRRYECTYTQQIFWSTQFIFTMCLYVNIKQEWKSRIQVNLYNVSYKDYIYCLLLFSMLENKIRKAEKYICVVLL